MTTPLKPLHDEREVDRLLTYQNDIARYHSSARQRGGISPPHRPNEQSRAYLLGLLDYYGDAVGDGAQAEGWWIMSGKPGGYLGLERVSEEDIEKHSLHRDTLFRSASQAIYTFMAENVARQAP